MPDALLDALEALGEAARTPLEPVAPREVGRVLSVAQGIARVDGLPGLQAEEVVRLDDGLGLALILEEDRAGVVLLDEGRGLTAGSTARRTGRVLDVPVGEALLGRVVDPLGRPLDGGGPPAAEARLPVEREAPSLMERAPVRHPLQTGVKVVDALVPVGRGQRELILGDRQTGKTALALDAVLNQRNTGVVSVWCAVGQSAAAVASLLEVLRQGGALPRTLLVVAGGDAPPGLQYLAPFAATSMAEHFMHQGRDALVVYDDLTRHARAYRELSLLLRRPPGREAFPGDVFYLHSRLLERATRLRAGGSLTALPLVETQAGNIADYIPTNLISITDGQIYLGADLFQHEVLPAVDVGLSVSRVGGDAQLPAYRAVAASLRLSCSQLQELEIFARFSARMDEATRRTLERGRRVRQVLRQPRGRPVPVPEQVAALLAAVAGAFDPVPLEEVAAAEARLGAALRERLPGLCRRMEDGEPLDPDSRAALLALAGEVVACAPFSS